MRLWSSISHRSRHIVGRPRAVATFAILEIVNESAFDTLRRWELAGGHWRVLSRNPSGVTLSLLRCDGGEEVHRLTSPDPALAAHIGGRDTDE
jgi:hypothetical protein